MVQKLTFLAPKGWLYSNHLPEDATEIRRAIENNESI